MLIDNAWVRGVLEVLLCVVPGILIATFVYRRDRYEREPHALLAACFFMGMVAILPAVGFELLCEHLGFRSGSTVFTVFVHAFFVIALSEELSKYLVLRYLALPKDDFNEPFDGITYSVMIAMGFATVENLLYVFDSHLADPLGVALRRAFTAVPAHAANAVLMGYFMGLAKFARDRHALMFTALMTAVVAHGLYDFFIFLDRPGLIAFGAIAVLSIAVVLSLRAMKIHQINSPFRQTQDELNARDGQSPVDESPQSLL